MGCEIEMKCAIPVLSCGALREKNETTMTEVGYRR